MQPICKEMSQTLRVFNTGWDGGSKRAATDRVAASDGTPRCRRVSESAGRGAPARRNIVHPGQDAETAAMGDISVDIAICMGKIRDAGSAYEAAMVDDVVGSPTRFRLVHRSTVPVRG